MPNTIDEYKSYVRQQIDGLIPVFASSAIGDFSQKVNIPDSDDEFTELYVGIQIMLEVINEKIDALNRTNKELQEKQIKTEKEKLLDEAILENVGEGLVGTDHLGRIVLLNRAAEKMLGIRSEDIVNKELIDVIEIADSKGGSVERGKRPIIEAITTGKQVIGNFYFVRKNSTKFFARTIATPMILDNKVFGAIEVFRDITAENEIDRLKDELIALSSHELRTPMAAIKGYLSMVLKGDYGQIDPNIRRPLEIISSSNDKLIELVNNMLEASQLESQNLSISLERFDIAKIVKEVSESLYPMAKEKNLNLKVEGDEVNVNANSDYTRRIIQNIIMNAIKFTHQGEIDIKVFREENYGVVEIRDTGIGIDPSDTEKLFKKFQQITTKEYGKPIGTGLGLYISSQTAKKMGGEIRLKESSIGHGSTFILTLPLSDITTSNIIFHE